MIYHDLYLFSMPKDKATLYDNELLFIDRTDEG